MTYKELPLDRADCVPSDDCGDGAGLGRSAPVHGADVHDVPRQLGGTGAGNGVEL